MDTQWINFLIICLSVTILKAWTLQTHMLNASGLLQFNSSYLHIATFYKTQLLLLVFQDCFLQNMTPHHWIITSGHFDAMQFPFLQGSKCSVIIFLVLQCLRKLSIQLPSNAVLYPKKMEYTHSLFDTPLLEYHFPINTNS